MSPKRHKRGTSPARLGLGGSDPGVRQLTLEDPSDTRRCHRLLGNYSDHVFACAQGPGMRRHNRLRDTWIQLCRRAGWHTDAEQLVYIAPGETKRADLVTLTLEGQRLACDVMVTAAPAPGSHMVLTWMSVLQPKPQGITVQRVDTP